jgi:oligoendopeptidase F
MLMTLGFSKQKANYIADKIEVDPARGSGHAWGAAMKGAKAHLRTRIPSTGMNYKGYNIAVHEFGHNVEQTISLYDVDYYSMHGVPNTAFTEALAFVFQKRDLMLLGINNKNPKKDALETLDNFWSLVEIMGVSLVDQEMWKWMYKNPEATPAQLKEAVLKISKDVWNLYFAPVFGVKDQMILAIYSHMINAPLYLSNYAFGYLIQFQIEQHLKNSDFATEVERIYSLGRLTPGEWMKEAVHKPISINPVLENVNNAMKIVK